MMFCILLVWGNTVFNIAMCAMGIYEGLLSTLFTLPPPNEALLGGVYAPCSLRHFTPFSLLPVFPTTMLPAPGHFCPFALGSLKPLTEPHF